MVASCKRQCVRHQTLSDNSLDTADIADYVVAPVDQHLPGQTTSGAFFNWPLEVPVSMMSGSVCCTVSLHSFDMRVSEIKQIIEVKTGVPISEQDIYLDGCPNIMKDERRLCHYAEALYSSARRLCLVRRCQVPCQLDRSQWKRLKKEFQNSQRSGLAGFSLSPLGGDLEASPLRWRASIDGPAGSPYEGGQFALDIHIPPEYPYKPPSVVFSTPIFHPLVSPTGSIDVDMFHENWVPILTLEKIINRIQQELADPYSPQVQSAGTYSGCGNQEAAILSHHKEAFDRRARNETLEHATPLRSAADS